MTGRLEQFDHFVSAHVRERRVDIWVPPGYDVDDTCRVPVLYMHDGQNLFDASTSFSGVDWAVHGALGRLIAEEGAESALIVGIWNTPDRIPEYMPERPMRAHGNEAQLERFTETYGGEPRSDAYLRFVATELKPFVDRTFRTRPERESTCIMGSSMGGLISLYAICQYPDVFGHAACLSTSWTIGGPLVMDYLRENLPAPGSHRLYFDYGVEAQIARYEGLQKTVDRLMVSSGFQRGSDWMTERFPGAPHSESAWRDRVDVPLRFFFGR